jgi:hypothetical protein
MRTISGYPQKDSQKIDLKELRRIEIEYGQKNDPDDQAQLVSSVAVWHRLWLSWSAGQSMAAIQTWSKRYRVPCPVSCPVSCTDAALLFVVFLSRSFHLRPPCTLSRCHLAASRC